MGDDVSDMPDPIKGLALSCIISDTLEFRSPTTTRRDREVAERLAKDLKSMYQIMPPNYFGLNQMFQISQMRSC